MSTPPLQIGRALASGDDPASFARALDRAEHAERLGLHSLWLPEGHFHRGGVASPILGLAAFAARTRRIHLGTTSLLLPVHHPLRLAADVTTLDHLCGGRLLLGLGRGFRSPLFRGFGVDGRSKRDRFDESLDAMLGAWSGEAIDLGDTHFAGETREAVRLPLRPLQQPHPPLLVAAFGPRGLRQAALRRLPYLASPLETLDTLVENQTAWLEDRAPGPTPPGPRHPVMRTLWVTDAASETRRVLDALAGETRRIGRQAPPALRRAAAGAVEDRVLVGEPAALVDTIGRYRERLGMDLLVVRSDLPGETPEAGDACLERLMERVVPALDAG